MPVDRKHKNALGNKIRKLREAKTPKLSQREMASRLGITNVSLSDIEKGNIFPSEKVLLKIMNELSVPKEIRESIYSLFSEAKGVPPPDISQFIKGAPSIHSLLRELSCKKLTDEKVAEIEKAVEKFESL